MITYRSTQDFTPQALQELFLSVEWSSGNFPDKLSAALKRFGSVFSAWDGDRLVGMICSMDDGVMNAYVHYLLVRPDYQGRGIGRRLVEMMRAHYKDYLRIVLGANNEKLDFYQSCGFQLADTAKLMWITDMIN